MEWRWNTMIMECSPYETRREGDEDEIGRPGREGDLSVEGGGGEGYHGRVEGGMGGRAARIYRFSNF